MRVFVCIAALAAFVVAVPHPQAEPTDIPISISATIATSTLPVIASTSLNIPVTVPSVFPTGIVSFNLSSTSRRRNPPHSEPIPIFQKPCDCPDLSTVGYPCWATDALQVSYRVFILLKRNGNGCYKDQSSEDKERTPDKKDKRKGRIGI